MFDKTWWLMLAYTNDMGMHLMTIMMMTWHVNMQCAHALTTIHIHIMRFNREMHGITTKGIMTQVGYIVTCHRALSGVGKMGHLMSQDADIVVSSNGIGLEPLGRLASSTALLFVDDLRHHLMIVLGLADGRHVTFQRALDGNLGLEILHGGASNVLRDEVDA